MTSGSWYVQARINQQGAPHAPSPIELIALERELREAQGFFRLRAQQYTLPVTLTGDLITLSQDAGKALEALDPLLSEARDRMERQA